MGVDPEVSEFAVSRLTYSETSAVLATMLANQTAKNLLSYLDQMNQKKSAFAMESNRSDSSSEKKEEAPSEVVPVKGNAEKLQVVTIKELIDVLSIMTMTDERERHDV